LDGFPIQPRPSDYDDIEKAAPPDFKTDPGQGAGTSGWKEVDGVPYYCQGNACGRWYNSTWMWMKNQDGQWWMQSDAVSDKATGAIKTDSPAFVWHQQHWWWQEADGPWYVIHQGEPWSYRYIARWNQNGLVNPKTGTQMVYTDDGKVKVATPGKGTIIYDATTGKQLSQQPDAQASTTPNSAPQPPNAFPPVVPAG
jgi:hypothetical protein